MATRIYETDRQVPIGEVIGRSAGLFRTNPAVMLGAPLAVTLLQGVLVTGAGVSGIYGRRQILDFFSGLSDPATFLGVIGAGVVLFLIGLVAQLILQGIGVVTAAAAADGEQLSFGTALGRGLAAVPRLLLLSILLFGIVMLLFFVPPVVLGAGVAATAGGGAPVVLLVALIWLAMVVAVIWLVAMWAATPGASAVERRWAIGAIRRSAALTRGLRWRMVGLYLVIFALYIGVGAVLAMVQGLLLGIDSFSVARGSFSSAGGGAAAQVVNSVISITVQTFIGAYVAAIHGTLFGLLRQRHEGMPSARLSEVFA
ncbi:MAG: hypothetical protein K2X73_07880 [Sphingomonas sp.]|uniref:hypothetical protein n=1 Tax=Sphingomonas sp. TaxID=28214 RepID=UPI0025E638C0|nr:hypothetical protein [Sphingomonas sp.]MBX9881877.1 hypothetical protein [Sphingomonas sp.]